METRPLTTADAQAVYEVTAAQELHDVGEVLVDLEDIVADWQKPSMDVPASTMGWFDGDRLVGYAEVADGYRGDAAVHPDYRGRGIGTAIAAWTQERARALGSTEFGLSVAAGSDGDRLMAELGYHVRWTSWVLELPAGVELAERPLPGGLRIVTADTEPLRRGAWTVTEDAFLEWSKRERESFEDWAAGVWLRPGFEPWQLRVVVDADDEVLGSCFLVMSGDTGYVDMLAVRRDQRGQGLAQALLVDAYGLARAHGATRCDLSTDSRTGALGLYEHIGMVVTSTWVNRGIAL